MQHHDPNSQSAQGKQHVTPSSLSMAMGNPPPQPPPPRVQGQPEACGPFDPDDMELDAPTPAPAKPNNNTAQGYAPPKSLNPASADVKEEPSSPVASSGNTKMIDAFDVKPHTNTNDTVSAFDTTAVLPRQQRGFPITSAQGFPVPTGGFPTQFPITSAQGFNVPPGGFPVNGT